MTRNRKPLTEEQKARLSEYAKRYNRENRVELNRKNVERRRKNPEFWMLVTARARAKKKGIPFDLELEDIVIPTHCPILKIELKSGEDKSIWTSPTLDRIDNERGYVKGNVAVISKKANTNKGNMTVEEIERLLNYMKKENIE